MDDNRNKENKEGKGREKVETEKQVEICQTFAQKFIGNQQHHQKSGKNQRFSKRSALEIKYNIRAEHSPEQELYGEGKPVFVSFKKAVAQWCMMVDLK